MQSCKHESKLLLVRITVCIESSLPIGWLTFIWWKMAWIVGCWNSLLTSCNPKNNWCLTRIYVAWFGGKDRGLSTCKPWSKQAGGWIHFCMKRLRTLNSYQIFKIKNKKQKTYSGWCPLWFILVVPFYHWWRHWSRRHCPDPVCREPARLSPWCSATHGKKDTYSRLLHIYRTLNQC